jgi:hypothetical protein
MPLILNKKTPLAGAVKAAVAVAKPAPAVAAKPAPAASPALAKPAPKPAAATPAATGGKPPLAFLKKGKAAQEAFAKEEHKQEMNSKKTAQRYWIKDGTDGQLTFLDGQIAEGSLDIPCLYEHNVNMNGKWGNNFICTQDTEPCPICEGGGNPAYEGLMTVIDHSEYTSKKDGKVYKDQVRLFVAKRETIKQLQKIAIKRGGLRGIKFDVSRTGDKSPGVGNMFDFVEKLTEAELVAKWGDKSKPIDYATMLSEEYMDAASLRKLGFGNMTNPIGSEAGVEEDYDSKM